MRILRNGEIWMRKSHLMNDFREIEHGFECLRGEYSKSKPSMDALFDGMFPGFCERLEKLLERPFRVYRPFGVHPPNEMARPSLPSAVGAMQRCGVMRCNETAACCIASRESRAPLGNIGMHSPLPTHESEFRNAPQRIALSFCFTIVVRPTMRLLCRIVAIASVPAWMWLHVNSAAAQDFNDRWSIIPKAHAEPAPRHRSKPIRARRRSLLSSKNRRKIRKTAQLLDLSTECFPGRLPSTRIRNGRQRAAQRSIGIR